MNIGVIAPLEFPFNLFINLKNLLDIDQNFVYFFVYSLVQKRIEIWGVYIKSTQQFLIDGSCKYTTSQLYNMTKTWKNEDYLYIARPFELIGKYTGQEQLTYSEYLKYKFIIGYFKGLITEGELDISNL